MGPPGRCVSLMLIVFGLNRLAVAIADLYFQHPSPPDGQEGPEHGVRLELRRIEAGQLRGSIYSARPISINEPVWRADLLESVAGKQGSFDRTHHHPHFSGWDESHREFEEQMSADPIGWLRATLSDLPSLLTRAGVDPSLASPDDVTGLAFALPQIVGSVEYLLARVRTSELGRAPKVAATGIVRSSWL